MTVAIYPAHLAPYPSHRLVAAQRLHRDDYPRWDGWCLKLGPVGLSINWPRRG